MLKYNIPSISESYKIPFVSEYKYKLDMGENLFPLHDSISNMVVSTNKTNINVYPVKDTNFDKLIEDIKKYNNIVTEEDVVMLTNGSDNALRLICLLFCTPDTKVLIPVPTYPNFETSLKTYNCKEIVNLEIDYKLSNDCIYGIISDELTKKYDLCYLVNPNMPIGYTLSNNNIETLVVSHPNTMFIIDEAYLEYCELETNSKLITKYNNIIIVRTFSKFFGIPAVRIGYLIASNKIIKLLDPYYNQKDITNVAINCAITSLANINHYKNNNIELQKVILYIHNFFNIILKCENKKIYDYVLRDGMYFMVICKNPEDLKTYFDNNKIAVRNKNLDIKGAIRITIPPYNICEIVMKLLYEYQNNIMP